MFKPSRIPALALALPLLLCSCSKEDVQVEEPTAQPVVPIEVQPAKLPKLEAAVASVQLQENCPDEPPAPPAPAVTPPASPAKRAPARTRPAPPADAPAESSPPGARAAGPQPAGYRRPCIQSRIQITFTSDALQTVAIGGMRLLAEDGKVLSPIESRGPSIWSENGYTTWDEVVSADKDIKASYKIAPPSWAVIETALGKGSYGATFIVEVDINFQGKTKTIRSSSFVRARPMAPPPT